ncbi:flagellar basal body protein [Ramlibacter sp. H39-3-26]|uniref:flagellar basal body protein n=1 Tax=Curvibacter soli TaxID=3031331 RepID=UPI0023DC3791|nr:flagellar basal body protein [Ramlibacter sp. H39-3-26]MDF1485571.1 flagellar basal body protein [Ramlibacter sp. H39-3-26]
MTSLSSIALSGLQAAQLQMDSSAHNIANLNTEGFHRQTVEQQAVPDGGVRASTRRADAAGSALAEDLVNQVAAGYAYKANLRVIETERRMAGALLDARA